MSDIKAWLNRAKRIDDEVNALIKEQEKALIRATSAGNAFGNERVQATKKNVSEGRFIAYAEYSRVIDERIDELYAVKCEILNTIRLVDSSTLRTLLELRYLCFDTWESIADKMGYSYVHIVHNLHPQALKKIKELIEFNTDSVV